MGKTIRKDIKEKRAKRRTILKHTIFSVLCMLMFTNLLAQSQDVGYVINGHVAGLEKDTVIYLSSVKDNKTVIDSAEMKSAEFIFKGSLQSPQMVRILYQGKRTGYSFFLENLPVTIIGDLGSKAPFQIKAGMAQEQLNTYDNSTVDIKQKGDSLTRVFQTAKRDLDTMLLSINRRMMVLKKEMTQRSKEFAINNPMSHVSLYLLNQFQTELPPQEIEKVFQGLDISVRDTPLGKELEKSIQLVARNQVGQPAINFTQNDVNNNSVNLESFRGKYVLIDFWASWCSPCRKENPNVVKAFNNFKKEGFTILGVSLDEDGNKWKEAIKADHLEWAQVSDLKGWKNEVALAYNVGAIPANVLISPEGIIIARDLRGEQLIKKLNEVFYQKNKKR